MSQVVPTWTQLPTSTQSAPPPLTGHVAVVWRNEFIVHGGGTDEGEASDRTYFYDLDARRWVARELAGQPALARRDHAAALVGERLFLFGGASAAGQACASLGLATPVTVIVLPIPRWVETVQ